MTDFNRLIAVCCELRENLENHKILKNCKKIGEFLSAPEFTLIKINIENEKVGLKKGSNSVVFEVYQVHITKLNEISKIKGFYQHGYAINVHEKVEIDTPYGKATTFLEKNTKITNDNIIKDYDYKDYQLYKIKK